MHNLILNRGEVLTIRVSRGRLCVTCRTGRLWATSDREGIDNLLVPGDSITYRDRGTVVVEALRTTTLSLDKEMAASIELGAPLRAGLEIG